MTIIGLSSNSHDASLTVIKDGEIKFASQNERFSKIKNDENIGIEIINEALKYIDEKVFCIAFYENPFFKKIRQLYAGQIGEVFDFSFLKSIFMIVKKLGYLPKIKFIDHHRSHVELVKTTQFKKAICLVVDSIGEFDTISFWKFDSHEHTKKFIKLFSYKYPSSLGLFYTNFTKQINLKANEEEYILMAMADLGKPIFVSKIIESNKIDIKKFKFNNFHIFNNLNLESKDYKNYAASVQFILELALEELSKKLSYYCNLYNIKNVFYSGGVALNCVANSKVFLKNFENFEIFPNPGDAGCSLGAALYYFESCNFQNMFLGLDIKNIINIEEVVNHLINFGVCGLVTGRAEFGPRALGHRSLLANPNFPNIKNILNDIKKRERFRPFSPVILEEDFKKLFHTNRDNSRFMCFVFKPLLDNETITHTNGFSRVQTLPKNNEILRLILEKFKEKTGCSFLLNTSLNIKGQPIVNTLEDALKFEKIYNIKVFK